MKNVNTVRSINHSIISRKSCSDRVLGVWGMVAYLEEVGERKNHRGAEAAEFSRREKAAELNQRFDDAEDDAEKTTKKPKRTLRAQRRNNGERAD